MIRTDREQIGKTSCRYTVASPLLDLFSRLFYSEWPIVQFGRPWKHLLQKAIRLQEVHTTYRHREVDRIPIPFATEASLKVRLGIYRCLRLTAFRTYE